METSLLGQMYSASLSTFDLVICQGFLSTPCLVPFFRYTLLLLLNFKPLPVIKLHIISNWKGAWVNNKSFKVWSFHLMWSVLGVYVIKTSTRSQKGSLEFVSQVIPWATSSFYCPAKNVCICPHVSVTPR